MSWPDANFSGYVLDRSLLRAPPPGRSPSSSSTISSIHGNHTPPQLPGSTLRALAFAKLSDFSWLRTGTSSLPTHDLRALLIRVELQLRTSVRGRKAFEDFKEANLTHPP